MTKEALEFEKLLRLLCNVSVIFKNSARAGDAKLVYALRSIFSVLKSSAAPRIGVTTIVVALMLPRSGFAGNDLMFGGTFRAYPLAGVIEIEAGRGVLLRGEANSPFSSYARARLFGSSAFVYNSLDAAVEFFPLAIAGLRAGGEAIQNDSDYSAFDCQAYRCLGRYYRTYIEGEVTLGAGPVFAQGRWRRERWAQASSSAGDFIDPTSAVVMKSEGDSQTVYYGVAGYKLSEAWTVLGVLRYAHNDQLGGWSRFPYGVLKWKQGALSMGVGAGVFESSLKPQGLSAVLLLRWEILPNLAVK